MALENITEAVTLNGESIVDDQVVVVFNCRIAENGIAQSISNSIRDHGLYQEHRSQVRKDQAEFQNEVWDVEDRLSVEDEVTE